MIPLSEQRVIEDTFFKANLVYYKPSLYNHFSKNFLEENSYSENSDIKLKHFLKGKEEMAFNTVLKKDIRTMLKEIKTTPKEFDDALWRDMLPQIRGAVKKTLGLDFKTRSIFFQDSFPEGLIGYEKKGASSVTIFEGQKDAGIYFLNKRVSSFFTPLLMIHEQMHSCLSQNKTKEQMYIEWFEEGLCMWYSMHLYHELTKNMQVLNLYKQRCHIYSQVKGEHNFTRRYYEYMKIMSLIYLEGGPKLLGKMLLEYLENKRDRINSYLTKDFKIKYLPNDLENFLVNFSLMVEPEKLPPIEYLVLLETLEPQKPEEIAAKLKVPPELAFQAIFALQMKGMVFVKNEKVEINWRKKDLLDKNMIKPFWPLKE